MITKGMMRRRAQQVQHLTNGQSQPATGVSTAAAGTPSTRTAASATSRVALRRGRVVDVDFANALDDSVLPFAEEQQGFLLELAELRRHGLCFLLLDDLMGLFVRLGSVTNNSSLGLRRRRRGLVLLAVLMTVEEREGQPVVMLLFAEDRGDGGGVEDVADVVVNLLRDGGDQRSQIVSLCNGHDTSQVGRSPKRLVAASTTSSTHDGGTRADLSSDS